MGIVEFVEGRNLEIDSQYIELLSILERVNPCGQEYHMEKNTLVISYKFKMDLLNLWGRFSLKADSNIIGLPISISRPGYIGREDDVESFLRGRRGLWVVLNGYNSFSIHGRTLSTFVFKNRFNSFEEYLLAMRSPYRRRLNKALEKLPLLTIEKGDYTREHHLLYREVVKRSQHPLEVLSKDFFFEYNGDIYDFRSRDRRLLGFVQTKIYDGCLMFLFCGFKREDVEEYDLYFNMLLWIIRLGINAGVKEIDFGQTSEESKLKIGCIERDRFLFIHHHNPVLRFALQKLLPKLSYKSYPIKHRVFKEEYYADIS
ncbi:MAG: hypothetical protein ACQEP4_06895 [Bacillota bacterium]